MKLKRVKAYKKLMNYLQLNFGFREPYQVLLDEEIILAAVESKYDIVAGLERTLQGKVKPMVTQCTMEHLYRAKTATAKEAIKIAKTFERRRCGHIPPDKETVSAFECITECVGPTNKNRYCVATQKPKLRAKFRSIPAIPLIYINRSVMIMEPMSKATQQIRAQIEDAKLTKGLNDASVAKRSTDGDDESNEGSEKPSESRKRKIKGPNPLSVKKKRVQETTDNSGAHIPETKKRRKRGKRADKNGEPGSDTETKAETIVDAVEVTETMV